MSAVTSSLVECPRVRRLTAMGLRPWVLRDVAAKPATLSCVVIVPAAALADARQRQLVERAVACLGFADGAVMHASVRDGRLAAAPAATPAYLVFGQLQAQALGSALSAAQLQRACIALVDEPSQLLATPARKRDLWLALKAVRRAACVAEV